MKKVLMLALAVVFSIAFVTAAFAQAPAERTTTTTITTPGARETVTTTTKTKAMKFKGLVTNMDMSAMIMTVKDKNGGEMTFDVSSAQMKRAAMAGDKVTVRYMEKAGTMMASSVSITGRDKTTTTTTKTKVKTE